MSKVCVIGHRNPDTDSICSALAYANLKNEIHGGGYKAYRAGNVNGETAYVLDKFGVKAPTYVNDVKPKMRDINYRKLEGVKEDYSIKRARDMMVEQKIMALPVLEGKKLKGLISNTDIMQADMDVYDNEIIAKSKTPYKNLVEVLDGTLYVGDPAEVIESGKLTVSAASVDTMESFIRPKDVVILANRPDAQKAAINRGVQCIVVCMDTGVDEDVIELAKEKKCTVIATPYDTFIASRLICQSIPVSAVMVKEPDTIEIDDYIEDVTEEMTKKRYRYFPVLSADGEFVGMGSRRRLLEFTRKQVILVDHNEVDQAVLGLEECEILEIIDHHRIGSLETVGPVYFRNQPVGCTATIVTQMYHENGVEITKPIAGLLCSAILSDTLMFRSPTCTPVDEQIAKELAVIAEIDIEEHAKSMFRAGSNLKEKSAEEIFYQDYKKFSANDINFGVGQITSMDQGELDDIKDTLLPYIESAREEQGLDMVFFMLTNILEETTHLIVTGENSIEIIENAFETKVEDSIAVLPGVLSRKKQMIPNILKVI